MSLFGMVACPSGQAADDRLITKQQRHAEANDQRALEPPVDALGRPLGLERRSKQRSLTTARDERRREFTMSLHCSKSQKNRTVRLWRSDHSATSPRQR